MAESTLFAAASTGLTHSDPAYLDVHFRAAQAEYEAMIRAAGIGAGARVLDAGSGGGSFLPLLAEIVGSGGEISAVDLAPENIAAVKARVAERPLACPVTASVGSLLELPYADRSFDALWSSAVIQYFTDEERAKVLREFRRVVRPGGLVAIKDADVTCLYISPVAPDLLWRTLLAARTRFVQVASAIRMPSLRSWMREVGLTGVRQASVLVERWAPLSPVEAELVGAMLRTWSMAADAAGMAEEDRAAWRALADLDDPAHPMRGPDFCYREGHILATGRVPDDADLARQ